MLSLPPPRAGRPGPVYAPGIGVMTAISRPLRLAEAVGALSLATDLAMGQPLEHGLRTAVLAVRIAQAMGLATDEQVIRAIEEG